MIHGLVIFKNMHNGLVEADALQLAQQIKTIVEEWMDLDLDGRGGRQSSPGLGKYMPYRSGRISQNGGPTRPAFEVAFAPIQADDRGRFRAPAPGRRRT